MDMPLKLRFNGITRRMRFIQRVPFAFLKRPGFIGKIGVLIENKIITKTIARANVTNYTNCEESYDYIANEMNR